MAERRQVRADARIVALRLAMNADLAVVALQHTRSYEREKRFAAEGQVLNEISKEIIDQISPYRVFDFR